MTKTEIENEITELRETIDGLLIVERENGIVRDEIAMRKRRILAEEDRISAEMNDAIAGDMLVKIEIQKLFIRLSVLEALERKMETEGDAQHD